MAVPSWTGSMAWKSTRCHLDGSQFEDKAAIQPVSSQPAGQAAGRPARQQGLTTDSVVRYTHYMGSILACLMCGCRLCEQVDLGVNIQGSLSPWMNLKTDSVVLESWQIALCRPISSFTQPFPSNWSDSTAHGLSSDIWKTLRVLQILHGVGYKARSI